MFRSWALIVRKESNSAKRVVVVFIIMEFKFNRLSVSKTQFLNQDAEKS
jgi:hypothetical protein